VSKPYTVTVTSEVKTTTTSHDTEMQAYVAYCRTVLASRGRECTVTLTWRPRAEQGMFGIHMPVQTLAAATHHKKRV
jgi:hypothetical protein